MCRASRFFPMAATSSCGRTSTEPFGSWSASAKDAQGLIEFGARFLRFEEIMKPFRFAPRRRAAVQVMKAFDDAGEAELFNDFVLASTRNLLDKYFSRSTSKASSRSTGWFPSGPARIRRRAPMSTAITRPASSRERSDVGHSSKVAWAASRRRCACGGGARCPRPGQCTGRRDLGRAETGRGRSSGERRDAAWGSRSLNAHPKLTFLKLLQPHG